MSETTAERTSRPDGSSGRVSSRVIAAVADVRGVEPTALPPLYDAIDPDPLDALFRGDVISIGEESTGDGSTGVGSTGDESTGVGSSDASNASADAAIVTFTTAGCEVVVESSGRVTAKRPEARAESVREP